jgi:hypothetical protein
MSNAKIPSIAVLKRAGGAERIGYGSETVAEGLNKRPTYRAKVEDIEALSLEAGEEVFLNQAGREGRFIAREGAPPSDPQKGAYLVMANGNYVQRADRVLNPVMFGAVEGQESGAELQAFFDFMAANPKYDYDVFGAYETASGLTINGVATRRIAWDFDLTATAAMDTVLSVTNSSAPLMTGRIFVTGAGGLPYDERLCRDGVYINNCRGLSAVDVRVENVLRRGVWVDGNSGNNTLVNLGKVRTFYCGTAPGANYQVTRSFSAVTRNGSSSSSAQRAVLTLTGSVPALVEVNDLTAINGRPYLITAINTDEIEVFPWLPSDETSGTVAFCIGDGVKVTGDDAASVGFEAIDATLSASAIRSASLYGFMGDRVVSQSCFSGLVIGNGKANSCIGNKLSGFYTEGNIFDLVQVTNADVNTVVDGLSEINYSKVFKLAQLDGLDRYVGTAAVLNDLNINDGEPNYHKGSYGQGYSAATQTVALNDGTPIAIKGGNSVTLNLQASEDKNRLYGWSSMTLYVYGARAGNRVDSVTINPQAGFTINGAASYSIPSVTAPVMVVLWFDVDNQDWQANYVELG